MDDRERCPKNPSFLKAYCAHCQGTEHGTAENPSFSIKEGRFHGLPVVEVLSNGGSIHRWDKNFRFGVRKAEMLISCVPVLRKFWQSSVDEQRAFRPLVIENQRRGLHIQIYVEMQPEFDNSYGATIDVPFLKLQALPPDNDHIGLGAKKCRAVCAVEEDLKRWLWRRGAAD